MREIKFRAWCPNEKEMYFVEKLPLKGEFVEDTEGVIVPFNYRNSEDKMEIDFEKSESYDALELMQYTGLKDKNGKEIYEGDILKVASNRHTNYISFQGALCFVEYIEDRCRYVATTGHGFDTINCFDLNCDAEIEVIGNIYESPELLEKTKSYCEEEAIK